MVLKSKNEQVKSELQLAQMFSSIGDTVKCKAHKETAKQLLAEVKVVETGLMEWKRANVNDNTEVNSFLKRGRMAMGIEYTSKKSKKAGDNSSHSNSDC